MVFPCLVRYLYPEDDNEGDEASPIGELSEDCADEVERVLEQRAVSVNLHPEIEDSCRDYLVQFCGEFTGTLDHSRSGANKGFKDWDHS